MSRCARPWLLPLVPPYAAAAAIAARCKLQRRLTWPVISIGNISTGGSGKTPLTMELARLLNQAGVGVDILSRGYGRRSSHPAQVNPLGSAQEFGDEPLLLARQTGLPVYVAPRRYDAGLLAENTAQATPPNFRLHILDDGMQHRQLHRNLEIVLVNQRDWQDCLLPAGNLRESRRALRRADVIAIPDHDTPLEAALLACGFSARIWRLSRHMQVASAIEGSGNAVAAFCGIAHPGPFFEGISAAGADLRATFAFPDHHSYSPAELQRIQAAAIKAGARVLLTTAKDLARLGSLRQAIERHLPVRPVQLTCEIQNSQAELDWLIDKLMPSANSHTQSRA